MKTRFLHICCSLLLPCILCSQELRFQNLNVEEGFTHSGTSFHRSILKDEDGFTWFVTYNGMSRFDGEYFKNYKHDPSNNKSIPSNILTVIGQDDSRRLWIGTAIQGIYLFDKEKETFSRFDPLKSETDKTLSAHILFIEKDHNGNMWYGGDHGAARWEKTTNKSENFDTYFSSAGAFLQTKNGAIWIGDRNGLHRKMEKEDRFEKMPAYQPIGYISDLVEVENGNIWIASPPNFWEFDPLHRTFKSLLSQTWVPKYFVPISFAQGNRGDIWMTDNEGILRYNQRTGETNFYQNDPNDPLSLPPVTPEDILIDSSDNLFVNTGGYGMAYAHDKPHSFETIGDFEAMEFIALDSHRVLIRDFKKGGIIYDTEKRAISPEKIPVGPGNIFLPSLALRGDSLLFIWDADIIRSYHLKTGALSTLPKNPDHSLYVQLDRKGRVWNGVSYLDEKENKWVNNYPALQKAFPELSGIEFSYANITFDEKNRIWVQINGYQHIIRYDFETQAGKSYEPDGVPYEGTNGRMYLNGPTGLSIYEPDTDSFMVLTEKEGLKASGLFHILEDSHGDIWLATTRGLQKFDLGMGSFVDVDFEDGFPLQGRTIVRRSGIDKNGFIYFDINLKKVFRFHPDSLRTNQETASVRLLDFYLNRNLVLPNDSSSILKKNLRYTKAIYLNYDQPDFGFSAVMPVFYKSKKIEYFYRLDPYQTEWQSNGVSNEFHFTNISPGSYTFRVKAKTASGVWSSEEASVKVVISPPWWKTWWAYAIYALLFLGTFYAVYRFNLNRQFEKQEAFRLKELDTLKSRLYTNITHEFRTPLTVIMGIADNLKGNLQESKLIRRNSKNLLRLINQLLDLSKLDSGTMKMDMVQGDVINYLRYLTESFYSMAQEKKIGLSFSTEEEVLEMDFDEVKVQHVIYNLLSNALKFTKEGGSIFINTSKKIRNNQPWLQIKVQDTGIGIPEKQLPHIFDRFFQADSSTTRKGEGTGIGLALTKELVQMMDGEISVKSQIGEGTEFKILLPAKKAAATAKMDAEFTTTQSIARELVSFPPAPSKGGGDRFVTPPPLEGAGGRPQLLLIEDNKDVATYIKNLLSNDYEVAVARDGQEGIDKALETVPDIIISDVMMPEKDGFEVCETLKQDMRTSHIPIILLTAKAEQKDKVTGLKYGADAYLMKPFDKEELLVRLEKLVELRMTLQEKYAKWSLPKSQRFSQTKKEPTLEEKFLQKLQEATEQVMSDPENAIAELEKAMHLSQMQLYRKLKALTGKTPSLYIRSIRLQKAMELLNTTDLTVSEIAYDVGFTTPTYFSRAFSDEFGIPPSSVRN